MKFFSRIANLSTKAKIAIATITCFAFVGAGIVAGIDIANHNKSKNCEHIYTSVVIPPTCKNNGYTELTCNKCGDKSRSDHKEKIGHSCDWVVSKEPTCKQEGTKIFSCKLCKERAVLLALVTPPTHGWRDIQLFSFT